MDGWCRRAELGINRAGMQRKLERKATANLAAAETLSVLPQSPPWQSHFVGAVPRGA